MHTRALVHHAHAHVHVVRVRMSYEGLQTLGAVEPVGVTVILISGRKAGSLRYLPVTEAKQRKEAFEINNGISFREVICCDDLNPQGPKSP